LSKFAIALAIIVGVPALCRRVRIPDAVRLFMAGVVIGPHGSGLMDEHHPVAAFSAQLAILLLMFLAGLA
jgi:Kef-type K+ transport system membrane component KefB